MILNISLPTSAESKKLTPPHVDEALSSLSAAPHLRPDAAVVPYSEHNSLGLKKKQAAALWPDV